MGAENRDGVARSTGVGTPGASSMPRRRRTDVAERLPPGVKQPGADRDDRRGSGDAVRALRGWRYGEFYSLGIAMGRLYMSAASLIDRADELNAINDIGKVTHDVTSSDLDVVETPGVDKNRPWRWP